MNYQMFLKSYWNYFLEIEENILSIQQYVNFEKKNWKVYSNEFIKMLEIICSEIDVIAKEIVLFKNPTAVNIDGIYKWGYEIQNLIPNISIIKIQFNNEIDIVPWKNWQYEKYTDKNGRIRTRLVRNKDNPKWWTAYNKVKHARTSRTTLGYNYEKANLDNVINSLGGLYILEEYFLKEIAMDKNELSFRHSKLFKNINKEAFYERGKEK